MYDEVQPDFVVPKTDICAGAIGKDACYGDSGGPMFATTRQGVRVQLGVTSRGAGCGTEYPGVWTDVGATRSWIDHNLAHRCTHHAMPGLVDALYDC